MAERRLRGWIECLTKFFEFVEQSMNIAHDLQAKYFEMIDLSAERKLLTDLKRIADIITELNLGKGDLLWNIDFCLEVDAEARSRYWDGIKSDIERMLVRLDELEKVMAATDLPVRVEKEAGLQVVRAIKRHLHEVMHVDIDQDDDALALLVIFASRLRDLEAQGRNCLRIIDGKMNSPLKNN